MVQQEGVIVCLKASGGSTNRIQLHGSIGSSDYLLSKHRVGVIIGYNCIVQYIGVLIKKLYRSMGCEHQKLSVPATHAPIYKETLSI